MSRVFLAIGISHYQHPRFLTLPAATGDAERIYAALRDNRFGAYSPNSLRIVDVTLAQVREALRVVLTPSEPVDTFTFYFAGHGEYRRGSYFLCCSDTDLNALSQSSFALSELLTILNEARPGHANILIDACRAGAVASDIATALKPDILGTTIGPSISIFASTAASQDAYENDVGGIATSAILDVLQGSRPVQSTRPFLDLVEVGQAVARQVASDRQNPAIWGLNLSGESQFCRNPHFLRVSGDGDVSSGSTSRTVEIARRIESRSEALRRVFTDAAEGLAIDRLERELSRACKQLDPGEAQVSSFIGGFSQSVSMRAAMSEDAFAEATSLACCVKVLLNYASQDPGWRDVTADLIDRFSNANRTALERAHTAMATHRRAMMSGLGGLCDFFVLPLRLSMLLGHLGIEALLSQAIPGMAPLDRNFARSMALGITRDYDPSLVSISDAQATHLSHFFTAARALQLEDLVEPIFGRHFSDLVERKGKVAKPEISGSELFRFLVRRAANDRSIAEDAALPSSLLAVLMAVAAQYNLDDVVDPFLIELDHESTNLFIPDRYATFGATTVRDGVNVTLRVGLDSDLGFFTTDDFADRFARYCAPRIRRDASLADPYIRAASILAATVAPNRQCWFLFNDQRLAATPNTSLTELDS